jgi:hypothetical protein
MSKQQDLKESTRRNLKERIKAIQEMGDGYITVKMPCSNLINGKCKDNLPVMMGCIKGTLCGFFEMNHAE